MGSNGLTSARHDVFHRSLAERYPESYDNAIPKELVYSGNYQLTDIVEAKNMTMGKLMLSPTRTYAPVIKEVIKHFRPYLHGMIHCSGGAQTKVLHFVNNLHVVKNNLFDIPPLFRYIQEQSDTAWQEMYKVFNMGHRLEIYVQPEIANEIIAVAKHFNIDARIVGYCEAADTKKLTIESEKGKFVY